MWYSPNFLRALATPWQSLAVDSCWPWTADLDAGPPHASCAGPRHHRGSTRAGHPKVGLSRMGHPDARRFGSVLLLFHEHHTGMHGAGHMSTMARIQAQHRNFALTGFGIGAFRGLSEVPTRWQVMYARLWPLLVIVLGALLVLYRE